MSYERIFLSKPDVGETEESALVKAIRSGWAAPAGPEIDAFEQEMAERIGVSSAVALSSGTAAIHLALIAVGVKPGDVVITSTMTFAATANAIVYAGATPYFIDSDPISGNFDATILESAIEGLLTAGQRPTAVLPVDLLGKVADYPAIEEICSKFGIPVVADAAESLGASLSGKQAGSFGAAAAISFNGNKIMTTSGGGMLVTDDQELAKRVRYLSTQARQPVIHYEHTEIGYNYRLSNLLAALGRAQLSRLDEMIAKRRRWRNAYREFFAQFSGIEIFGGSDVEDNCWLTSIIVNPASSGTSSNGIMNALSAVNIESRPLWKPMHLQPVFEGLSGSITGASENLYLTGLTLPSGSEMKNSQFERILETLSTYLESCRDD